MGLTTYIVRSSAGTRIAGFHSPEQASRSLLPGESASVATPQDITEHHLRIKTLIATAQAQALAAASPVDRLDVVLEALRAKGQGPTAEELAAAEANLKAKKSKP